MTSQSANYQAKVNFYHEAVGTVVQGKTVEIQDSQVAQKLEQMGYVQKVDAQVHSQMSQAQQEVQAKQAQYCQEQAKANENPASHLTSKMFRLTKQLKSFNNLVSNNLRRLKLRLKPTKLLCMTKAMSFNLVPQQMQTLRLK